MKIYIIAGEASGDLHGGNLIKELKRNTPTPDIRAWGGDEMEYAGANIVKHYHSLAYMGFLEVLIHLRDILKNFQFAKKDIIEYQPDLIILIDYPGFNLRIAKWAFKKKIPVTYYILPQLWAWNESRIKKLAKYTQIRLAILPFEKSYYKAKDLLVHYVGHPLVQHIDRYKRTLSETINGQPLVQKGPIIALLPGSRKQEIRKHIPLLLPLVVKNPDLHFEMAQAPGLSDELFLALTKRWPSNFSLSKNTYHLLSRAKYAVVCSGTATLETALFDVPQIVFYRTSLLNYLLAKWLLKVRCISLVNLILQKPFVKEVIHPLKQRWALQKSFAQMIGKDNREYFKGGYEELRSKLGSKDTPKECSKFIFNV